MAFAGVGFGTEDLGYGATVQPTGEGTILITVQSRVGPKSIVLTSDQFSEIVRQSEAIEEAIGSFKYYLDQKREAEASEQDQVVSNTDNRTSATEGDQVVLVVPVAEIVEAIHVGANSATATESKKRKNGDQAAKKESKKPKKETNPSLQ